MMNDESRKKLSEFGERCRARGLRITPQRVAIYEKLVASGKHPSATEIHDQIKQEFPNVSLGTVNSTLLTFAQIGFAHIVEGSGDPKRFDPITEVHHHFRCVKCNRIIDFNEKTFDEIRVPAKITERFLVLGKKVYLEGVCDRCQNKSKARS